MNKFAPRSFSETLQLIIKHEHPHLFRANGSLNVTQAANFFGIDQPTFRRWTNGANAKTDYIALMSKKLKVSQAQLRGEEPIPAIDGIQTKTNQQEVWEGLNAPSIRRVPVISSVTAGTWIEAMDNFHPGDADEWQDTTARISKYSFALRVEGKSMQNPNGNPSIPHGSIVIVDPEIAASNGKIVVAKLPSTNEVTIKKYVIDGPDVYLEPLNPDYKPILAPSECLIVGVVKQVIQDI